jgi:hypothetical protein
MKLRAEWGAIRSRIGAALHAAKPRETTPDRAQDRREWVIIYRTAGGFCCLYEGRPVDFEDMLDVQIWAEEMDVRPWFMGL